MIGIALLAVLGLTIFNPFRMITGLPIDIGKIAVSGTTITMESPHRAGFTSDKRPYDVSARNARQDGTDPTNVDMEYIKGKIYASNISHAPMVKYNNFVRVGNIEVPVIDVTSNIALRDLARWIRENHHSDSEKS